MTPLQEQAARISARVRRWTTVATLVALATLIGPTALALATHRIEKASAPTDGSQAHAVLAVRARRQAVRPLISGKPTLTATPTETPTATPPPTPTPTPRPAFVWPADGWIAQGMTAKHPYGIDIALNTGEPVRSVRDGRVILAGGDPCCSYGYFIVVEHNEGWTSLYGHMSAFSVSTGDEVGQGELLGLSGATGKAYGAHLHFELRQWGVPVNPLDHFE